MKNLLKIIVSAFILAGLTCIVANPTPSPNTSFNYDNPYIYTFSIPNTPISLNDY